MAKLKPEIELRWLLFELPGSEILEAPDTKVLLYDTLYLCHEDPEFRLRQITEKGQNVRYKMAVKEGEEGEERGETLIEPIDGARLFRINLAKNLPYAQKIRSKVTLPFDESVRMAGKPTGQLVWEFDNFIGKLRGIFMAEVEIPKKGFKVQIPHWLAPLIVAEVTDRPEFYNKNMAANPQKALTLANELKTAHSRS